MVLEIIDAIGEDPRNNPKLQKVIKKIESKTGWKKIKETMNRLVELCGVNYQRELNGEPPHEVFVNRMFLGGPGCGKTTCAKLYGELLKHLGFLSNGDVVLKTAGDFVGQVVGESQNKTISILNSARGKVLVIDEAYVLDDSLYGKQVLDTLVEKVQNSTTDDIAVLLLGYEEQMDKMIRSQNPGLARRFPKDYAFYFDDYTSKELLDIMKNYLKQNSVEASAEFQQRALEALEIQRHQANFGNAGAVELLVKGAIQKATSREIKMGGQLRLEINDLDDPGSRKASKSSDPLSSLDGLYRMETVKLKIESLRDAFIVAQREGDPLPNLGHFVFTGAPGTGKTTVARAMAEVLYGFGLIPTSNCIETSGLDLTGDYLGQTKTKVNEKLREAKGGILFIDEAYNLGFGQYGKEACDTIVAAMTSDEFKDLVIIIAGYPADMHQMLNSNAGLKSRFTQFFEFPDWEVEDCTTFFASTVDKERLILGDGVHESLRRGFQKLKHLHGWGNGRDVVKVLEASKIRRASRIVANDEVERTLQVVDVQGALDEVLQARQEPTAAPMAAGGSHTDTPTAFGTADPIGPPSQKIVASSKEFLQHEVKEEVSQTSKEGGNKDDPRDDGVTDEIWAYLCEAKKAAKDLERQGELYREYEEQRRLEEQRAREAYEAEVERIRKVVEEAKQQEVLRRTLEAEERRKRLAERETRRREQEERHRLEKIREQKRMRERIRQICPCPMGYSWYKCGAEWRCAGGSHYVSDDELKRRFVVDL